MRKRKTDFHTSQLFKSWQGQNKSDKQINGSKRKNRGKHRETLLQNKMAPSEEIYNYSGV